MMEPDFYVSEVWFTRFVGMSIESSLRIKVDRRFTKTTYNAYMTNLCAELPGWDYVGEKVGF